MFWAPEVIPSPQTQESTPSFGAIHSAGTPSRIIDSVVPRPPSAITTSPDLKSLTIEASDSAKSRNWSRWSIRYSFTWSI